MRITYTRPAKENPDILSAVIGLAALVLLIFSAAPAGAQVIGDEAAAPRPDHICAPLAANAARRGQAQAERYKNPRRRPPVQADAAPVYMAEKLGCLEVVLAAYRCGHAAYLRHPTADQAKGETRKDFQARSRPIWRARSEAVEACHRDAAYPPGK